MVICDEIYNEVVKMNIMNINILGKECVNIISVFYCPAHGKIGYLLLHGVQA